MNGSGQIVVASIASGLAALVVPWALGAPLALAAVLAPALALCAAGLTAALARRRDALRAEVRRCTQELADVRGQLANEVVQRQLAEGAMRALADLGAEMTTGLATTHAAARICDAAVKLLGARRAVLYEAGDDRTLRSIATAGGGEPARRVGHVPPAGLGIAGRALREGRIVTSEEANEAAVGAPLLAAGEVVGVVAVADRRGRVFVEEELRLLSAFADVAALGLHNARLGRESEACQRATAALLDIAHALESTLDVTQMLTIVAQRSAAAVGAERCSIHLVQESGLAPAMSQFADGRPDPIPWSLFQEPPARTLEQMPAPAEAIRTRRPVVIEDVRQSPMLTAGWISTGVRSVMVVPLVRQDEVLGTLELVRSREPFRWRSEQIDLAVAIAHQAALALQNARLYERAEGRAERLRALTALTRLITSASRGGQVFEAIARVAATLVGAEVSCVWVDDPAAGALRVRGRFAVDSRLEGLLSDTVTATYGSGAVAAVFESRRPRFVLDAPHDLRCAIGQLAVRGGLHAFVGLPMVAGDRVLGVLTTLFRERRECTQEDREILGLLADHAAIAIQNTLLYEARDRRAERLRELARVSRLVSASLDTGEVLSEIASAAAKLTNAPVASLWIVDEAAQALTVRAFSDDAFAQDFPVGTVPFGASALGKVAADRRPLEIPDVLDDPRVLGRAWWRAHGLRSFFGMPIFQRDAVRGVLVLAGPQPFRFGPDDLTLLESFAGQAGVAMRNAELYQEREQAYRDLSETQEQLAMSQRIEAVGRLAGGVAHDFNNVLTVIGGHLELIARQLRPEDPLRRRLHTVTEASSRAGGLVKQLLAFGRKQVLQPRVLDLGAIVTSTATMLARLVGEDIELVCLAPAGLGRVTADPGQIEQVIVNLVVNARDAMPRGGRLTLATTNVELDEEFARRHPGVQAGRYVLLEVRDTGVGMDEAIRGRIFEPFFTTKEPGKGTGLGLATVYGIVKQHNGSITVESAPGRGTVFRVYLPRVEAALEPLPEHRPAVTRGGTETILLVEDQESVGDLARDILREHGYRVIEARRFADALRLAERHAGEIQLVLTDVVMPHASGQELAKRLAPILPSARVLYMSGYTEDAIVHHGVLDPGTWFIAKPFTPGSLAAKIREVLDHEPAPVAQVPSRVQPAGHGIRDALRRDT
jgi:GAF domain-containing protein/CheY-like chemotaxis protein